MYDPLMEPFHGMSCANNKGFGTGATMTSETSSTDQGSISTSTAESEIKAVNHTLKAEVDWGAY